MIKHEFETAFFTSGAESILATAVNGPVSAGNG